MPEKMDKNDRKIKKREKYKINGKLRKLYNTLHILTLTHTHDIGIVVSIYNL